MSDPRLPDPPPQVNARSPAELRADERYRRLAHAIGLKLGEYDLTNHPDPFEVRADVTNIPFDPYEVPSWQFAIGTTHTARTTGALRITGDGRMLLPVQVQPLI